MELLERQAAQGLPMAQRETGGRKVDSGALRADICPAEASPNGMHGNWLHSREGILGITVTASSTLCCLSLDPKQDCLQNNGCHSECHQ